MAMPSEPCAITKVLLATHNKGKVAEFEKSLKKLGLQLITLEDIEGIPVAEEKGDSFLENAVGKAKLAAETSGIMAMADDSGLEVDYLEGKPGIYSARFAGEPSDDRKNNEKLLSMLSGVPLDKRAARFVCVIAVAFPDGRIFSAEGKCEGIILEKLRGTGGFGYDPLFYIPSKEKTFAELTLEEKELISHRGKALSQISQVLARFLFP